MQGCILATDMSRHDSDLNEMKAIMDSVPEGTNQILSDEMSEEEKEKRRQRVCELVVHASDIGFSARTFQARKIQCYLLFEEFFNQGDIQAEAGVKVSFLCDRSTTNVAQSQPGFISYGPLRLFDIIGQICPSKAYIKDRLLAAQAEWTTYTESEKDKEIYEKRPGCGYLNDSYI